MLNLLLIVILSILNNILFCSTSLFALELEKVFIVSKPGNEKNATDKPKFVQLKEKVVLHCIIRAKLNEKSIYFSDIECISINDNKISTSIVKQWDERTFGKIEIKWFKVEPYMIHHKLKGNDSECLWFNWYTNAHVPECEKSPKWIGYDILEYQENELKEYRNKWSISADAHPFNKEHDINDGLGVMRYKVEVSYDSQKLASPGVESIKHYGISEKVHLVNFRTDDTYLGWLTSYFNVPGIFGSTERQVESYIGIDCADLVL